MTPGEVRDGLQVGAFFGLVAGVVALVIALLAGLVGSWFGAGFAWRTAIVMHLAYLPLYALAGGVIGARWPLRTTPGGHFGLRSIAAVPVAVTVASVTLGPIWRWPASAWPKVLLMIPAFAWVFGGPARRLDPPPAAGS